ncbi:MAG: hypothetical protein MJ197_10590 [Bacteroidales bacterium]|nr:hypothetical protein [Bacteroidales bacterium]
MQSVSDSINSIKSGFGCVKIYPGMYKEHTYMFVDGRRIDENTFSWKLNNDKAEAKEKQTVFYLTLNDLSSQFYTKRRHGVLTVVVEKETSGTIYQIGKHNETIWEKHGVTVGYEM